MREVKYSCGIHVFGNTSDRFVKDGYKEDKSLKEMIGLARQVPDLAAIELVEGWHVNRDTVEEVRGWVGEAGLAVSVVHPDLWTTKQWAAGALAAADPKTRKQARQVVKNAMDMSARLNANLVDVWFGMDGWEYALTQDYLKAWDRAVESLVEVCDHNPQVRVGIEYKIKEPRVHMHFGTLGKVMMLVHEADRPNLGVIIDFGHAFFAYENGGQSIAMLKRAGNKLYHTHFNDNYRLWDDDLIPASVNIIDYIELLYWLEATGFDGWYSLDIFPYREDGVKAATESIRWLQGLRRLIARIGMETIRKAIEQGDAIESLAMIRRAMLGGE
jgi:xylose isomerase